MFKFPIAISNNNSFNELFFINLEGTCCGDLQCPGPTTGTATFTERQNVNNPFSSLRFPVSPTFKRVQQVIFGSDLPRFWAKRFDKKNIQYI